MDRGDVSQSPAVEKDEGSSAKEEEEEATVWCLRRVGKSSGWLRLVEGTEVTLGRALNVTYQLLSHSCPLMISRQHCLFKQNGQGQWTVTDKKSLNGVWVNGDRIVAEKAWPLSKGDSVRLGVPVEGMQMEFEYELVQARLEAVMPSLCGPRPEVEEVTAPPRAKKTKRGLEPDPSGSAESRAKLYRCAAEDKSRGRPCPALEPPLLLPQLPQLPQTPGPSAVTAQPEGHRPAPRSDPGAGRVPRCEGPHVAGKTLRDGRQQQQELRSQQPGCSEEIRERHAQQSVLQLHSQQPGRSEDIRELQAQQSVLQAQLRSQQPGRSEDIRELQAQLRSQQPGRSEEIKELHAQQSVLQAQLSSQQPGRSEDIRELHAQQSVLQARLRSQQEQQLEDLLHQEEMRLEVDKRQQQEEHLKKQLEDALQEQRKVAEELKCSRQGFEEILQAKDKELEMTKEEKDQARAQKDKMLIQMTDVLENELQCIICSELLIEAATLSCAHSFCWHCIGAWRQRSAACPICRQDIMSQTRSLVLDNCIDRMVDSLSAEVKEHRQALIAKRKEQSAAKLLISDESDSSSSRDSEVDVDVDVEDDMSDFSSDAGSFASFAILDDPSWSSQWDDSSSSYSSHNDV